VIGRVQIGLELLICRVQVEERDRQWKPRASCKVFILSLKNTSGIELASAVAGV